MRQVNAFIGGVQKCATTSLHNVLVRHPAVLGGDAKELHFFDDETIDWAAPDYSVLHDRFDRAATASPAVTNLLDSTPIYLFWPPALRRIQAYNPRARFIFLFRDPIERASSHWRMESRRGAETLPFSAAIRQGRWRLPAEDRTADAWRIFSYVERGFYARQLRAALDVIDRDRLLLLSVDDVQQRPAQTLGRVCDFLEIAPFEAETAIPLDHVGPDEGGTMAAEDARYLADIFRPDIVQFAALSGLDVGGWPTMKSA